MKQLAVIAFALSIWVIPFSQHPRQPRTGVPKKESGTSAQLTSDVRNKQQDAETTAISAISAAITKENQERTAESQQETTVEQENTQAEWQAVRAEWWLVWVGIAQTLALIGTLGAIGYQGKKTADAAQATRDAARATEKSVRLQEVQLRQWVETDEWAADRPNLFANTTETTLTISFNVTNRTRMPLTLDAVTTWMDGEKSCAVPHHLLAPDDEFRMGVPIGLKGDKFALYKAQRLSITIFGEIDFTDAFENSRKQLFGFKCECGSASTGYFSILQLLPSPNAEDKEAS